MRSNCNLYHAILLFLAFLPASVAGAAPYPAAAPIDFNRDVRPILAENCFACHGMDANRRVAGLRLDTDDALKRLPSGRVAVVPGNLKASALYTRVTAKNATVMPPPATGKKLTAKQIETLRRWIAQGGRYAAHWAYTPVRRPVAPSPRRPVAGWSLNPIDRFLLARMEQEGIRPSPEADRRTLIRRLSLDLTGLPPTPEEVSAFVGDRRPDAYERLVDRLLASPHYGERMAVFWLDLVRYADTVGYHGDQDVTVWPFRDWVIRAFNTNKRFDAFTREQIAGDLLPNATRDQKVASGYNRLGMMSAEGGVQDKEYRAKYAAERVRNASVVWLGQTMGCAECHDHKFDPITTKEFYRFAAFFADLKEKGFYDGGFGRGDWGPKLRLPTDEQQARLSRLDAEIESAKEELDSVSNDSLAAGRAQWEAKWRNGGETETKDPSSHPLSSTSPFLLPGWTPVTPDTAVSSGGATMEIEPKGIVFVSGTLPAWDTYTVTIPAPLARIAGIRLETLGDERLPGNGVARSGYYFALSEVEVALQRGNEPAQPVSLAQVLVNREDEGYPGLALIDGRPETAWALVNGGTGTAVFRPAEALSGGPDTKLIVRLRHETLPRLTIGKFRLWLTAHDDADTNEQGLPDKVLTALRKAPEPRSAEERETIATHYRTIAPDLAERRARLARLEAERSLLLGEIPHTLVAEAVEPRVIRVLPRGNWMDDSGEIVEPGVPAVLLGRGSGLGARVSGAAPTRDPRPETRDPRPGRATRLDLANWIVSPQNPLTARVFVNRLWKLYFGAGLSRTLDDFGKQGEAPAHPELLDWLADSFMRTGWDVKKTIRLIVTSRAYRQDSKARPDLMARDPYNRLYARQMPIRLDAEFVRDVALRASGLLSPKVGGPSVKPYQPRGYLAALNFPRREWPADVGENLYRRGLYIHWQRTFLHPSLLAFDASTREECVTARTVSNTPMQALVLLNDPIFVEAARAFGARILREGGPTLESRLGFATACVLSRPPRDAEVTLLRRLYHTRRARYSTDRAAAEQLIRVGDAPLPKDLDPVELATWASIARVLLNLHETITRG
jgi:hypothetical protein